MVPHLSTLEDPVDAHDSPLAGTDVDPWLVEAVARMARGEAASVDTLLCTVGDPFLLANTRATVRTHFLLRDGNGRPRLKALAEKLADQIIDFCVPRSRINEARDRMAATGSTEPFTRLAKEAKQLFTSLDQSGEGGELLLYFLLEVGLGIPQVLCKMPLKTSSSMHVHGTDGIHARMLDNGNVALYWGESKMHKSATSAVNECFESIAPFLTDESEAVIQRDMLLMRDHLDSGSVEVTRALVRYFISDTPESSKIEVRAGCLVGFDLDAYPHPFEKDGRTVAAEVKTAMSKWHDRISKRIGTHELESFEMEVFLVPVPSVDKFRQAVRDSLGLRP